MANKYLFLDTGALYSYFDENDKDYAVILSTIKTSQEELITTDYVVDELITLLRFRKVPLAKFRNFINDLFSGEICNVWKINDELISKAWEIMQKYSDHEFSFTDCTSFAVMKENNITLACSLDKHFKEFGVQVIPEIK